MRPLKIFAAFALFVTLLAAIPAMLNYTGHGNLLLAKFWVLFVFITGFTFIVIASVLVVQHINPALYAQAFLATTIVKMLGCMAFALLFVLKLHIDNGVFLLNFSYLYFLNTGFEVYVLLRNLRNQNRK
ncbi:hypothetical protein [Mucilaginibacter phyllosphaerae]|uniref:Amino acid transporter n=1 Tax=Mucilaginibacter phyllosphaerae TaxID=1812349 RepID=A0A4Y8ALV5_9SPHI|nr:hypothetical protein [Mucilaginibacter phyllosphaerae]MBB3967461.1 amino acid transporter [Mucilaginibacter phyllosphaerae]TEW69472.1 hypothetical protein E2R65_04695 [Mucilaginibacter phyllosphaerae]GGH20842.1 hypothetical protein GCM10007352_33130 [Mucilaginibacter phyllosphaerae]